MCLDLVHDPLPPVALASRSPRRRELLTSHGVPHQVIDADIDDGELSPGTGDPRSWVMALAYLKAQAGAIGARNDVTRLGAIVLGADTVCVKDRQIIGQPVDRADARRIMHLFRGTDHQVLTGVALVDTHTGARDLFVDVAHVHMGDLSDAEIESYLDSGQWQGKAGAYNLSERIAAGWPIVYEGDPTSIMGLPMEALTARLRQFAAVRRRSTGV